MKRTPASSDVPPSAPETPTGSGGEAAVLELELERFLPYRLSVLSKRISTALAREYEERFGISLPQWRVMAVIGRHDLLSAGEVAGRTQMDKVKVSRAIAAMERKGLLHRTVDPKDLRVVRLHLTPAGVAISGRIAALALDWERRLVEGLDPRTRAGFERAIQFLNQRLDLLTATEASSS